MGKSINSIIELLFFYNILNVKKTLKSNEINSNMKKKYEKISIQGITES